MSPKNIKPEFTKYGRPEFWLHNFTLNRVTQNKIIRFTDKIYHFIKKTEIFLCLDNFVTLVQLENGELIEVSNETKRYIIRCTYT